MVGGRSLRTMSYLPQVNMSAKGHLSCRETYFGILGCHLKIGLLYDTLYSYVAFIHQLTSTSALSMGSYGAAVVPLLASGVTTADMILEYDDMNTVRDARNNR